MNNWPTKKLGEVCEKIKIEKAPVGANPYVEIGDVNIETKNINFKKKGAVKGSIFAPPNCIIVSRVRPTRGAAVLLEDQTIISSAFTILKPKPIIDLRFLFLCTAKNPKFFNYLGTKQKGSNYPSCKEADILDFEIPLPPLEVQKKIVTKVESLLAKVSEAKKLRAEAQESASNLLSAELHKIFKEGKKKGWEEKELGELVATITPPRKIQKKDFQQDGNYPIIDQSQTEIAGWTNDAHALVRLDKPVVIFGDHTRVVKYIKTPFVQGADGIKILSTKEELLPKFLYIFLKNNPIESSGYRRHF